MFSFTLSDCYEWENKRALKQNYSLSDGTQMYILIVQSLTKNFNEFILFTWYNCNA